MHKHESDWRGLEGVGGYYIGKSRFITPNQLMDLNKLMPAEPVKF